MIKMIVTDLDGTLLNANEKISNTSKEYLKKLKDNGYVIVVATGRIYKSALKVTDGAAFANYLITDTGSFTYSMSDSNPIFKNTIDKKIVEKIFDYYNDTFNYIDICDKNHYYKYSNDINNSRTMLEAKDKDFILTNVGDVSHIDIVMKNNNEAMNIYHRLLEDIKDVNLLIMQDSFSERKWIEILPNNVSKFKAINDLSKSLNIHNKDIICFGDGLNDIDMLEGCGYGVAMKNALIDVKKIANDITIYDNNHDGVTNYLKDHLDVK